MLKKIQQLTQENKIYKKCIEEFEEQKQQGQDIMRKYYQDETKKKILRKESNDNGQREETSDLKDSTYVKSKVHVVSNNKSAEEGQCDSDDLKIYPKDVKKNVTNSNMSLESDHKDPSPCSSYEVKNDTYEDVDDNQNTEEEDDLEGLNNNELEEEEGTTKSKEDELEDTQPEYGKKVPLTKKRRCGLLVCIICKSRFASKDELMKHIHKKHRRISQRSCPHCYVDFNSKKSLNIHIDKNHFSVKENTKRNICQICELKFDTK